MRLALLERLELNEDESAVGRAAAASAAAAAGEADDAVDRGILLQDVDELGEFLLERLERDALIGADAADQRARVLLREKSLWHDHEQIHVERDRHREDDRDRAAMGEAPGQAAVVETLGRGERALERRRDAARLRLGGVAK